MLPADKAALRRHFTALREGIPPEARAAAQAVILERLFASPAWKAASLVCGYTATRGEPDLTPVWARAIAEGKAYGLPVTVTGAAEGRMIFRRLDEFSPERLIPARFGILEPPASCPVLPAEDFAGALMLIPGLAFDDEGYRVGYGGGYYDRFLSELQYAHIPVTTVGAVFSVCRAPALPHEAHDLPVQYVISDR